MAWPARTWVAGELVTQGLGNAYWRDPATDLRAGGIAIASQAANDFLFASSATQWGRLAASAGRYPNYNGAAWEMANAVQAAAWPVGGIYESILPNNPGTILGVGTWVAFGTGRITVGIDAGQTEFDTVEETGGASTVTLSTAEIPAHTHTQNPHTHVQNSHNHTQNAHTHDIALGNTKGVANDEPTTTVVDNSGTTTTTSTTATNNTATATNQNATAVNQNAGGGQAHNNLQPYIVFYRWKRTA